MMTRIHDNPSVSGTNRKWYIAVTANWSRETSTSSRSGIGSSLGLRRGPGRIHDSADALGCQTATGRIREPDVPNEHQREELDDQHHRDLQREARTAAQS